MFGFLKSAANVFATDKKKAAAPPAPPPPPPPPQAAAQQPAAQQAAKARPPVPPGALTDAVGHYAEDAEGGEHKKPDPKAVAGGMDQMLGAVRVGFDKPEQILDALRGKDAATIEAMRAEFKKRMGPDASLDDWVVKQQGATKKPGAVTEAMALLTGDPVEGLAWGLDNAAGGEKADPAKITRILSSITDEKQRKAILEKYATMNPDRPLGDVIDDKMKGTEKEKAQALLSGDTATAKAIDMDAARGSAADGIKGKMSGMHVDKEEKDKMGSVLRGAKSDDERQKILMAYAQRRGGSCKTPEEAAEFFKKDAAKFTEDGADRDFFNAIADGKKSEAAAASIERAQKEGNLDTVVKEMESPIDEKASPEDKKKQAEEHQKKMGDIAKVWADKYGEKDKDGKPTGDPPKEQFQDMLTKAAGGGSMEKGVSSPENLRLQTVADEGQMDRYTMVQYGKLAKKPEMIAKAMEGLDSKGINELSAQGSASGDVVSAIYDSTKGRKQKDLIRDAMFGETPGSAADAIEKAQDMHNSELGKGKGMFGGVVTRLSDKDEQMDRMKARADELKAKADAGKLTLEEEEEAKNLPRSMGGAMKGFRADEDTTAKAAATPIQMGAGFALKPLLGPFAGPAAKAIGTMVKGGLTGEWSGDDAKDVGGSVLGKVTELATGSDLAGSATEAIFGLATKDQVGMKDILKSAAGVGAGAASGAVGEHAGEFAKEHGEGLTENELVKMAMEKGAEKGGEKLADKGLEKVQEKVFGKEAEEEEGGEEKKAEEEAEEAELEQQRHQQEQKQQEATRADSVHAR